MSIKFNNDDKIEGSLIIGCDGINSKVGEVLNPTVTSKFSNIIAWRGVIKMEVYQKKLDHYHLLYGWVMKNILFIIL